MRERAVRKHVVRRPSPVLSAARAQRGVALVIVLLLLLVVTVVGMAAMRGALLQERMAGNTYARSHAFQGAEAALREAEAFAVTNKPVPGAAGSGCNNGVCARPATPGGTPAWKADGFWEGSGPAVATTLINGEAARYVVEDFGSRESDTCSAAIDMSAPECEALNRVYRITVRGRAPNGAEVLLQSLYEVP